MLNRLILLVLVGFWGTMTWLLWRAEYGNGGDSGGRLPVYTVWQRVLTAPDDSTLEIRRHGEKIGTCRWSATLSESAATGRTLTLSELESQGRVNQIGSYTIDLDGQLHWVQGERPYKFKLHLNFTTNHTWSAVGISVSQRPSSWEMEASSDTQTVSLLVRDEESEWTKDLAFADFRRPEKILSELGVPWATGLLAGVLGPGGTDKGSPFDNLAGRLKWDARQDWFKLGRTKVRAYRLSAKLLEKFQIVIHLSRVGEVLRIELPDGIVAVNDAFLNL